jgi:Mitochondrial carrier protein
MMESNRRRRRTALADALAGVVGTLISLWAFYPLEVIKTNLQASFHDNKKLLKNESTSRRFDFQSFLQQIQTMFRGCSTKTLHASSSSFCYFFLYSFTVSTYHRHQQKRRMGQHPPPSSKLSMHPSTRLLLSAMAAMMNTFLTLPLDVLSHQHAVNGKGDKQSDNNNNNNAQAVSAVRNRLATSRTASPSSSSSDDSNSELQQPIFHEALSSEPSSVSSSDDNDDWRGSDTNCGYHNISNHEKPKPLNESLEVIDMDHESEKGLSKQLLTRQWTHLWKGLTPALLLCSNPAIHYTAYDVLKHRLLSLPSGDDLKTSNHYHHRRLSLSQSFLLGLVAKFIATVATYPLIRAKVLLMVTSENNLWSALVKSYRHDNGIRGLYKGCDWQLLHTLLKSALMMMVRERITEQIHQLIVGGGGDRADEQY